MNMAGSTALRPRTAATSAWSAASDVGLRLTCDTIASVELAAQAAAGLMYGQPAAWFDDLTNSYQQNMAGYMGGPFLQPPGEQRACPGASSSLPPIVIKVRRAGVALQLNIAITYIKQLQLASSLPRPYCDGGVPLGLTDSAN